MNIRINTVFLLLFVPAVNLYSAWTDMAITSDMQIADDFQHIVVTIANNPTPLNISMSGGSIGTLFVDGTNEVEMSGGTISGQFFSFDPENMDGDNLFRCPYENDLYVNDSGKFIMSGGVIVGRVTIASSAIMEVYGYGFQYINPKRFDTTRGTLQGFWANGEAFNLDFVNNSFDRVILHEIPEPTTLVLFLSGLPCFWLKKTYRKVPSGNMV